MSTESCGCDCTPCQCEIPVELVTKWKRAARRLNSVMQEILNHVPTAQEYLGTGTLHLMTGPSHEDLKAEPRQDRIRAYIEMLAMDGGDW